LAEHRLLLPLRGAEATAPPRATVAGHSIADPDDIVLTLVHTKHSTWSLRLGK
jgi:hypothetical protein